MDDEHFRRLERMYATAAINAFFQPRLRIAEAHAEVTLPIRPEFHHAAHAAHGATLFKALDDAAFFAANSLVRDVFVVTAQFNLHFLRPVAQGEVRAVGRVVHHGRRQILAEAVATDEGGREVARGTGTFVPSSVALTPEIGYS